MGGDGVVCCDGECGGSVCSSCGSGSSRGNGRGGDDGRVSGEQTPVVDVAVVDEDVGCVMWDVG